MIIQHIIPSSSWETHDYDSIKKSNYENTEDLVDIWGR